MSKNKTHQYPLGWDYMPSMAFEDFLISESNQIAFIEVKSWQNWASHAVCIYGPSACGKTHLSTAFHHDSSAYFLQKSDSFEAVKDHKNIIVEDVDQINYDEDTLFHLFNWCKEQGGHILFTARTAPIQWRVELPDLRSRYGLLMVHEIAEPDDVLLEMIYYKLFSDRQIQIDASLIKYLLVHVDRSFKAALDMVYTLDQEALSRKIKVSRRLASELLKNTNPN